MGGQAGARCGIPEAGAIAGLCPERHVRGLASAGGRGRARHPARRRQRIDAAIAAAVVLGFCEPPSCGLGGDAFVRVKPAGRSRLVGLNGSGRARAGLDAEALRSAGHAVMPVHSAAAVTVPGAVDAFVRLAADWGRLSLPPAGAGDRPCRGRHPGGAAHGAGLAAGRAEPARRGARPLPPRRRGPGAGAGVPRAGPGRGAAPDRPRRARRVLHRRGGRGHGRLARALGGTHTLDDFAATACTYVEPISGSSRPRALRAAAERPGRDRDTDGEDRRAFRSRRARPARRGAGAPGGRRPSSPTTRATASSATRTSAAPGRAHDRRRHRRAAGRPDRSGGVLVSRRRRARRSTDTVISGSSTATEWRCR